MEGHLARQDEENGESPRRLVDGGAVRTAAVRCIR
jgi:hypothetical protein